MANAGVYGVAEFALLRGTVNARRSAGNVVFRRIGQYFQLGCNINTYIRSLIPNKRICEHLYACQMLATLNPLARNS